MFKNIALVALFSVLNLQPLLSQSSNAREYKAVEAYIQYRVDHPHESKDLAPWFLQRSPKQVGSELSSNAKVALGAWTFRHGVRLATAGSRPDRPEVSLDRMEFYAQDILDEVGITKESLESFVKKEVLRSIGLFTEGRLQSGELEARISIYASYTDVTSSIWLGVVKHGLNRADYKGLLDASAAVSGRRSLNLPDVAYIFSEVSVLLRTTSARISMDALVELSESQELFSFRSSQELRSAIDTLEVMLWNSRYWESKSIDRDQFLTMFFEIIWSDQLFYEEESTILAAYLIYVAASELKRQPLRSFREAIVKSLQYFLTNTSGGFSYFSMRQIESLGLNLATDASDRSFNSSVLSMKLGYPYSPTRSSALLVLSPADSLDPRGRAPAKRSPIDPQRDYFRVGEADYKDIEFIEDQAEKSIYAGHPVFLGFSFSGADNKIYTAEIRGMFEPLLQRDKGQKLVLVQLLMDNMKLSFLTGKPSDAEVGVPVVFSMQTNVDGLLTRAQVRTLMPLRDGSRPAVSIDNLAIFSPDSDEMEELVKRDLTPLRIHRTNDGLETRYFPEP